jgi:hypothetical protein
MRRKLKGTIEEQAMVYVSRRLVKIVFTIMENITPYTQPPTPQVETGSGGDIRKETLVNLSSLIL